MSKNTIIGVATAIALLAAAVAVFWPQPGVPARSASPEGQHRVVATTVSPRSVADMQNKDLVPSGASSVVPTELRRNASAEVSSQLSGGESDKDGSPDQRPALRSEKPSDGDSDAKRSAATDGIQRVRVRSGPYVMSPSIVDACNDPGIRRAHICDKLYADIAQMANEPRDSEWSSEAEEQLQAYVEQEFPGAKIQNIDCRTSLCALEVTPAPGSRFGTSISYPHPLRDRLNRHTWMESKVGAEPEIIIVMYKRN